MGYIEKGRAKALTKFILWMVVISFIATIFVSWGARQAGIQLGSSTLFSVNGHAITPDDLSINNSFYNFLQYNVFPQESNENYLPWRLAVQTIGGSLGAGILQFLDTSNEGIQRVYTNIAYTIGDLVLAGQAENAGIRVSDDEIAKYLVKIYRDPNGNFIGQEAVTRDLQRFNIGVDQQVKFKELLKRHLKARHFSNLLFTSAYPGLEKQVREVYDAQTRKLTFSYAEFNAESYIAALEYSDEDLRSYLDSHKDEFVIVDMMEVDRDLLADSFTIADEEVAAEYESNKETLYKEDEERDVRRILIPLAPEAAEEAVTAAEEQATRILDDLSRPGEEFATVARKYSQDEVAGIEEDTIEGLTFGDIEDPAFRNAVFSLAEDGDYTTEAVRTERGLVIIQLVKKTEGGYKPLDEVAANIRERLADRKASSELRAVADELWSKATTEDWETLSEPVYVLMQTQMAAVVDEDELFSLNPTMENRDAPADTGPLFSTPENALTEVTPQGGNLFFYRISSKGDSLTEKFDLLKEAIRGRYIKVKSLEKAETLANDFAEATKDVTSLDIFKASAEAAAVPLQETETTVAGGSMSFGADLLRDAFEAGPDSVLGPIEQGRKFYNLFVIGIGDIDEADFDAQKQKLKEFLLNYWILSWTQDRLQAIQFLQRQYPEYMMLMISGTVEFDFGEVFESEISYLVNKSEMNLNREVLRAMYGGRES